VSAAVSTDLVSSSIIATLAATKLSHSDARLDRSRSLYFV
jgi:hypothetical protein